MATLKVFCTIAMRSAVSELLPELERTLGQQLDVTWGTAPMLVQRVESGETADVLILSKAGIQTLLQKGKIVPGSEMMLASSATAVAVKAGAPKPDISTTDAFVKALLDAKGVAYTHPSAGGASGVYFAQLIERLGIAEKINAKAKHPPAGGFSGELLLTGEADIAIQQKPELMHVAGTEVVGLFPPELNLVTEFVAGVMPGSQQAAAANALIQSLCTQEAKAAIKAKGLELS
ncbi:MAG TPA: substrate-binding domain-containing protein [Xanthobacteraceae bacterium]|jgi:molybdate transport system substrate-binding protein|nr:substrate-binding domain-containing protein [Xanthobacteraceae bacterium]